LRPRGGGTLSARYWSEAAKERRDPAGIFYFWKGERPRAPNAPQLEGTGEIRVETADRAAGYWTTRSDRDPGLNARTAGVYLRADPSDLQALDGGSAGRSASTVDDLDPAFASGTGTPEPGDMTTADMLWAARTVAAELELVGADVVEVIPLVADRIVREVLTGIALSRLGRGGRTLQP
jgi:hypothetical protein